MVTIEEFEQTLRNVSNSFAPEIGRCATDEEASELMFARLRAVFQEFTKGFKEKLQDKQRPEQKEQGKQRIGIDAVDAEEQAHQDWSNDE